MSAAGAPPGPPVRREPWDSVRRQREAVTFGTWVFLGSEALLFGGLIAALLINRVLHPDAFAEAGRETDVVLGTVNTLVLLTSSLTMAVGAEAARAGLRRLAVSGLALTALLGLAFLALKGVEWRHDLHDHLWPGDGFRLAAPAARIFFALYWIITALHGLHLLLGIGLAAWLAAGAWHGTRALRSPAFEAAALYWHLVDVVWVFLYPLLYLGGRT